MKATRLYRDTVASVLRWCRRENLKLVKPPNHIHPRAFVVGYAAPRCLIVARPWTDSEPQVRDFDRRYPLITIHLFDQTLKPGDWCITAYISRDGSGETVALPLESA